MKSGHSLIPAIILLSLVFASCDDNPEEISDTSAPAISVTMPPGSSVTGVVNISAMLEDLSEEVYVKILVDGVVKKEGSAKSIAFELDTRTLSDGAHTVTVIATDLEGNSSQVEMPLVVRNTLLTIHVSDHYIDDNTDIYYIISRNDGTLITYEQAQNGQTITIPTPEGFNPDSTFVVTQFWHSGVEGSYLINLSSIYAGVHAGEYGLPDPQESRTVIGQHGFIVSETPHGYVEFAGTNMASSYGWGGGKSTFYVNMFAESSDVLFYTYAGSGTRPSYLYKPEIHSGGQTTFNFPDLPLMNDHAVTLKEAASEYSVTIHGYHDDLKKRQRVYTDNIVREVTAIPAYYPASIFPNYFTVLSARSSDLVYGYTSYGTTPPTEFKYIQAHPGGVVYEDRRIETKATGNFDFACASSLKLKYEESLLTIRSTYVYLPSDKRHVVLPTLPQATLDLGQPSVETIDFDWLYVYDVESVQSADDYSAQVVFSHDGKFLNDRPQVNASFNSAEAANGRVATVKNKLPAKLQAVLDRYLLQHQP